MSVCIGDRLGAECFMLCSYTYIKVRFVAYGARPSFDAFVHEMCCYQLTDFG